MLVGLYIVSIGSTKAPDIFLPPKPVANPTVPSEPSTSTQKEPKTLIPQLVLDARYFSHLDIGVEIGVSINLYELRSGWNFKKCRCTHQWPPLTL
jgi:hypothetical protein